MKSGSQPRIQEIYIYAPPPPQPRVDRDIPRPGVWCKPGGWAGGRAGKVHWEALGFQPARAEVHGEWGTVWLGVNLPTGSSWQSQLLCPLCLQGRHGGKGEARGGIERLRTAAFTVPTPEGTQHRKSNRHALNVPASDLPNIYMLQIKPGNPSRAVKTGIPVGKQKPSHIRYPPVSGGTGCPKQNTREPCPLAALLNDQTRAARPAHRGKAGCGWHL